jgi:phage baseplate assembly protein W
MVLNSSTPYILEAAIQLPFAIAKSGKIADTYSQSKVWEYRVKSALGTILGERVMRPNYGVEIADIEFNTESVAREIVLREIERVFSDYLLDLQLEDIDVSFEAGSATLNVNVTYILPDESVSNVTVGIATINGNSPINEVQK